jgi:outer membrane cobalamin receptor
MPLSVEADVQPLVAQALAQEAGTGAHRIQQVDRALLQDAGPDTVDHIVAAAVLDNDGIDAIEMQEMPEHQSCGAGADDAHLRAEKGHFSSLILDGLNGRNPCK